MMSDNIARNMFSS